MKKMKDQLKSISKSLVSLSKQVDRLTKQVDKLQATKKTVAKKAAPKKAVKKKAAPKRKPAARKTVAKRTPAGKSATVLDTVLNVIKGNRNGVSIAALKAKTKLDSRQLSNALYKLSKKGQVRAKSRGVYIKK
ncbi:MAG: hypothetical protein JRF72_12530 [Deltaproteobacteria bacterium]|jgi:lambda repressor-like predicted transcriptional regulator|nr:hypothetical protein [Deltaproteobacteria bacterium]